MNLQNQTAMITGAAGHLGRAAAKAFRQAGASLVLIDRQTEALERAFERSPQVTLLGADLLYREQLQDRVKEALAGTGCVNSLCHIAGGFRMGEAVHEISPETWDFLGDLNARSFLNIASVVVPHFIEQGGG